MQNTVLISIPIEQLEAIIKNCVNNCLEAQTPQAPQAPPQALERLLTIQEAAKLLNLTTGTMYVKNSNNEFPFAIKRGKRVYFSDVELMAYMKAGRRKTQSEINAAADLYLTNLTKKGA